MSSQSYQTTIFGRDQIGKNGIIRDKAVHQKVLETVTSFAVDYGFTVKGLDFSPIQGGHGNIEFSTLGKIS